MLTLINETAFRAGHHAFLRFLESESGGIPFRNFEHPYFYSSEVAYKHFALAEGQRCLSLEKWKKWKPGTGRILEATKEACSPTVSRNLLEHRYGSKGDSASPLYRVKSSAEIMELENELMAYMLGGDNQPASFGPRFDHFADFLRGRSLGCKWPFLAYLAFLMNPSSYFPILPGRFGELLRFYEVVTELSGRVEWTRYERVLQLAHILKDRLVAYGTADNIDIQSYMWVVSGLIPTASAISATSPMIIDFNAELKARMARAAERERIGLLGEQFVLDGERKRLAECGRSDLADSVRLVSVESNSHRYDILSFDESGRERHIEVKSTSSDEASDQGFWLSEFERACGQGDLYWSVARVWGVGGASTTTRDLGNIILDSGCGWSLQPNTWFACRLDSGEKGDGSQAETDAPEESLGRECSE